jgi:hypothetical protein
MREPYNYGQMYWCVKVTEDLSENGDIYVNADRVSYSPNGDVIFKGTFYNKETKKYEGEEQVRLIIASGKWDAVYSASCIDGHAIAVDHWKGEIVD